MAENLKGEVQRWKRRNDGSGDGLGKITESGGEMVYKEED